MKNRKPIKRTLRAKLNRSKINDEELHYLCLSKDEWDEMEITALERESQELPKELWYENWIPYATLSPTFFEDENDEEVRVISWTNGILISHIPMLGTLEHLFFSRLVSLDLGDAIDFCIISSQKLDVVLRKKFLLKLIEETGYRATALLPAVNDPGQAYKMSDYGPSNLIAFSKLNALEKYFITSIFNKGDLHSLSIEFTSSNNNDFESKQLSFKQIIDQIKVKPSELSDLKKKQILAWANMPFVMWPFKLPRGFPKDIFFKFLGKLFSVEILDQPASNINQALAQGTYHDDINALQELLINYQTSFNSWQDEKEKKKKAALLRSQHQKFDSNFKRNRT